MKLIAITSPATDAGKTFVSAGIAEAATYHNLKTLFIELDNPVGDSLRVFGLSPNFVYPTLGTWENYNNVWEECLQSHRGTYILPKPDALSEDMQIQNLLHQLHEFDLVVADLGTDYRQNYWETIVEAADIAFLVSDCDEKALVRVKTFLDSRPANKEWSLIINSREKEGYYTEDQVARELSDRISTIITIPYYPDAEKRSPKTYPPESYYMAYILNMLFEHIKVPENFIEKLKAINIPQIKIPFKKKPRKVTLPETPEPKKYKGVAGVIINGEYQETTQEIISKPSDDVQGIIIPASWGEKFIKEFRRNYTYIPLVVVGGNNKHIHAGADRCIKKVTPSIITEIVLLSEKMKALWEKAEIDPLTGLYKRDFLNAWMKDMEDSERAYTAVMIDIDKFKNINDTYGHQVGDMVLSAMGAFLKNNLRYGDISVRYGGEEFVVCLPDTNTQSSYKLIDRLREKWSERKITLDDGREIACTFSAGIAEWPEMQNVINEADKRLYEAKNSGRNRVCISSAPKILTLGVEINDPRVQATDNPDGAIAVIASSASAQKVQELALYIILSQTISDWAVQKNFPEATFCNSVSEAIDLIMKPNLVVLPRAKSNNKHQTIPYHGAVYVLCPSRPAAAGEVAVQLSRSVEKVALVCASGSSMAAKILNIPDRILIKDDWRLIGSGAPIDWEGMKVWPADPYKYITTRHDIHKLVDDIKKYFALVVVDCAGNLDLCQRIAHDEGVVILHREGDASDAVTSNWIKTYGNHAVMTVSPREEPIITKAENGFIISYNEINRSMRSKT